MNTLPFAKPSDALLRRAALPLPAAAAHRRARRRRRRRSPPATRSSSSTASSPRPAARRPRTRRAGRHLHDPGRRDASRSGSTTSTAARATASASSPARAGIRSSWTPRAALKTIATGKLAFTDPGVDLPRRQERPEPRRRDRHARCWAARTLVGVVAETLTRGKFNVRIERVGRPEVKNMMLAPKQFDPVNRDLEIRDLYNMEDAFHLGDAYARRLPRAAERQPRLLGRPRRQDRLAARTRTAATR